MLRVPTRLQVPAGRRLRRVLLAYGLSRFTECAGWLTILLVAYEHGGAVLVGVASFAMQLPAIVLVPLLAGLADRMPRSRALGLAQLAAAVGAGLTAVCLLVGSPLWLVLVAGVVLTTAVYLIRPLHFAVLPILARGPGDLVAANAWSSFMDGCALFVGFGLAGLFTAWWGAWVVLAICAVLSVLATLLCRIGPTPMAPIDADAPAEIRAALAAVVTLRRTTGALALLALMACTSVMSGSNEVLTVTYNDEVLGLSQSTAGLLAGCYGLGMAVGGLALVGLSKRPTLAPVVIAGGLLVGLCQAAIAFLGSLAPVVIMLICVGVGVAMILVSARTLLQRTIDDGVLARVLAIQEGIHLSGMTLGAVVGPLAVELLGPSRAFLPMGVVILAITLLSVGSVRSLDAIADIHAREVALLSQVPFLAALPANELERLAQGASWVEVASGTEVVRQGDEGDSYYLVASGELSVTIDGRLRDHTLTAGDGFGEIALLHRVRRTATITAVADCEILVIDSERFLAAVTASPVGSALARATSAARLSADHTKAPDEGTLQ